jgi:anti-sigma factor RsiW
MTALERRHGSVNCTEFDDLLSAYADGETVPAQSEFLELHMATCSRCQQALARYRNTRRLIQSALDDRWVPPDLSDRVARAYWQSRGIPRLTVVIGRLGVGIAALLVVSSLLLGRAGMLPTDIVQHGSPVAASIAPRLCDSCAARQPVKVVRVRGHLIPITLVSEVTYDLDSAVPLNQVSAQLLPQKRVDEVLSHGSIELKGGDAGRGQYVRSNGPVPL